MNFCLLTSVYASNTPEEVRDCFRSISLQTVLPTEVVVIIDGPISQDLISEINFWENKVNIVKHALPVNKGLANALNIGLSICKYDYVARIDIDDICIFNRFELQLDYLKHNKFVDILGGQIEKFDDNGRKRTRFLPLNHNSIVNYCKYRNPINHPSVFFKKDAIHSIGGYPSVRFGQDYLLWIEAIRCGLTLANLSDVIVLMRVGNGFYKRRGLKVLMYDLEPYFRMRQYKILKAPLFFFCITSRFFYALYCSVLSILFRE